MDLFIEYGPYSALLQPFAAAGLLILVGYLCRPRKCEGLADKVIRSERWQKEDWPWL